MFNSSIFRRLSSSKFYKTLPVLENCGTTPWEKAILQRFVSGSAHLQILDFTKMPSPRGLPIIGTSLSLILAGGYTRLHQYVDKRHNELGSVFKDNVGPVTAVFLSDAEEMRKVFAKESKYPYHLKPDAWLIYNEKHNYSRGLFFMDGEEWLQNRRIMNNLLMKGDLSWLESACQTADSILLERLMKFEEQTVPDLEKELYKWSMDVTLAVVIGANTYREHYKVLEQQIESLAAKVRRIFETTIKLQLISAKLAEKYSLRRWKKFERSVTEALDCTRVLLEHVRNEFMGQDGLLYKMVKQNVSQDTIDRIIVDLILGAGDTTSSTLAWALYSLAKRPDIQDNLRKEFMTDPKNSLVKNIVRETLRLYPSAPFLTRILPDPLSIGGYLTPANTLLVMSIYTSGRDEKYFRNPNEFEPNRWLRDSTGDFPKTMASLPFAMGARSCVGRKIAETALYDILGNIVLKYKVELDNTKDVREVMRMILKPNEPLKIRFKKI